MRPDVARFTFQTFPNEGQAFGPDAFEELRTVTVTTPAGSFEAEVDTVEVDPDGLAAQVTVLLPFRYLEALLDPRDPRRAPPEDPDADR